MKGNRKKQIVHIKNRRSKAGCFRETSGPTQWNHTLKIANVVSVGTKEASRKARQISDGMIKVRNGMLVEEKRSGEIIRIKEIAPTRVHKQTITLNIKKSS